MSVIQKGVGVKWGVAGTTYAAVGYTLGQTYTGRTITQGADMEEHMDENGETKGLTFKNGSKECQIEFYFSAATLAAAKTNAAVLPVPGTKFTVTDASDSLAAGDYVITASSRAEQNAGKATGQYTAKRWDAMTSYDTVT